MSTGGLTNLLEAAAAPAIRNHNHAYNLGSCLRGAGDDANTNPGPNQHDQDAANATDLQVANNMQAMTVQSLREIMGIGASYGNSSLANDHMNMISAAGTADDRHEQFSMMNQGHAYQDGLIMDPKSSLGSFMFSNFGGMGEDAHAMVGAGAAVGMNTPHDGGTQAAANSSKAVDHSTLILQSYRNQALYNSASEMMMSASTDQRIPYRTQLQRESHILAERQRREEMNEKFTILRTMIPKLTKKDKASIVTDTINYIKELEKKVSYLQSCKGNNTTKAHPHVNTRQGVSKRRPDGLLVGASDCEKGLITNDTLEARPSIKEAVLIKVDHHQDSAFLAINAEPFIQHEGHGDHDPKRVKIGQVEIENLGDQAVIKVLSSRVRGVVLRLHLALEECKVDVIQSNVTTVGNNMVHFVTVGLHPGISTNINELATALQIAATSNNIENVEFI